MKYIIGGLILLMSACAPTATPQANPATDVPPTEDAVVQAPTQEVLDAGEAGGSEDLVFGETAAFTVTVTTLGGAETLLGPGAVQCENNRILIATGSTDGNDLVLGVAAGAATGEYNLPGDDIEATLTLNGTTQDAVDVGVVTLDALPPGEGDMVSGNFDIFFAGDTNVVGTFAFVAPAFGC